MLIFALLGPVMALSSWWEARRAHRAEIARHEKAQRERDEEERAQEKRRKREEIRQLETRFPHPTQWMQQPLWRPQRTAEGPAIRIGCGTGTNSEGEALIGAPMVAQAPRGIALVGPAGLTEHCWPALVASVAIHQSRSNAPPLERWWPKDRPPLAQVEVVTSVDEAMVVQRCEDEAAVDERVDNVLRVVSPGYAQWFRDGVMVSEAVRLDRLSVHEALRLWQFLEQWFPPTRDKREAPPEPSRDNLVLRWSATGWSDLVRSGPHGVIWGQSGSGKTVLMNTLIQSISRRYRPEEVQVVVVDFKGGSGLAVIDQLPHLVGALSDLDGPLTARAFHGIGAEIRRRERMLREHRAPDLSALPLSVKCPRTLLVIDEVAALIHQHPEWEALFEDIASRGRALGLHLLLIGQRVAGQVPRAVLANASLRMCLRIGDPSEASDILRGASASDINALVAAPAGTIAVSDGVQLIVGQVEPLPDTPARPGVAMPLWLPALPQRVENSASGVLALRDNPEEQSQFPLRIDDIPRGVVLASGDSSAGHSTLLGRWAGAVGEESSEVLPPDLIGLTARLLTLVGHLQELPQMLGIDRLDRICRGQSEAFREWIAELIHTLGRLLADQPRPTHLVVTVAPGTPEARVLRRLLASHIYVRHALDNHSELLPHGVPSTDSPPGRIVFNGIWRQVFIPSHDELQPPRAPEVAPMPKDALVVCQQLEACVDGDNLITLAQADERFFDLERAYRSGQLVLVGVAGDALRALRIPPVPATASPEGWLLGPAGIALVRVGGLGALEDRVDADRVETESLADRATGQ